MREVWAGTQAKEEAGAMEEDMLAYFSLACFAAFLIQSRPICQEIVLPTVGCVFYIREQLSRRPKDDHRPI